MPDPVSPDYASPEQGVSTVTDLSEWLADDRTKLYEGTNDEHFHLAIEDAIEECWDGGPDPAEGKPIVVTEWLAYPATHHLPTAEMLLEWVSEWVGGNGEVDEDGAESFTDATCADDVKAAAEALLALIGSKVAYFMASTRLAEWAFPPGTEDAPPEVETGVRTLCDARGDR